MPFKKFTKKMMEEGPVKHIVIIASIIFPVLILIILRFFTSGN